MTLRYAHLAAETQRQAIKDLEELFEATEPEETAKVIELRPKAVDMNGQ